MTAEPVRNGVLLPVHQPLGPENRALPFQYMPNKACEKK